MVNKTSPGGGGIGGKKFKKGINIFSKKGGTMLPRGGPKHFFGTLTRANCAPPLNKSPRTPLLGGGNKGALAPPGYM